MGVLVLAGRAGSFSPGHTGSGAGGRGGARGSRGSGGAAQNGQWGTAGTAGSAGETRTITLRGLTRGAVIPVVIGAIGMGGDGGKRGLGGQSPNGSAGTAGGDGSGGRDGSDAGTVGSATFRTTGQAGASLSAAALFPGTAGSLSAAATKKDLVGVSEVNYDAIAALAGSYAIRFTASGVHKDLYEYDPAEGTLLNKTPSSMFVNRAEFWLERVRSIFPPTTLEDDDNDRYSLVYLALHRGDSTVSYNTFLSGLTADWSFVFINETSQEWIMWPAEDPGNAGGGFVVYTVQPSYIVDSRGTDFTSVEHAIAQSFSDGDTHGAARTFQGNLLDAEVVVALIPNNTFRPTFISDRTLPAVKLPAAAVFPGVGGSLVAAVTKIAARLLSAAAAFPGTAGSLSAAATKTAARLLSAAAVFVGTGGSLSAAVAKAQAALLAAAALFPGLGGSLAAAVTKAQAALLSAAAVFPGTGGSLAAAVAKAAARLLPAGATFPGVGGSLAAAATKSLVPLKLADFNDAGLDVETAALLAASAPGTPVNNLYADSSRGGSGSPIEGELGVGAGETLISRLRRTNTSTILLNVGALPVAITLSEFFGTGGDGRDLTISFQTADGLVSFTVADSYVNAGGGFVNFTLPAAGRTLLDSIATGDRFIFAMWRRVPLAAAATFPGVAGSLSAAVAKAAARLLAAAAVFPGMGGSLAAAATKSQARLLAAAAVFPGLGGSLAAAVAKSQARLLAAAAVFPGLGGSLAAAVAKSQARLLAAAAAFPGMGGSLSAAATKTAAVLLSAAAVFPGTGGRLAAAVVRKAAARLLAAAAAFPGVGGSLSAAVRKGQSQATDLARSEARSLSSAGQFFAIDIEHPQVSQNIRVVADSVAHEIDGETYEPLAFRVQPLQDRELEIPRATIEIDNTGHSLTKWVNESRGGVGATMRLLRVLPPVSIGNESEITMERKLRVGKLALTSRSVEVSLVAEPTVARPAILKRHDAATSPGLF